MIIHPRLGCGLQQLSILPRLAWAWWLWSLERSRKPSASPKQQDPAKGGQARHTFVCLWPHPQLSAFQLAVAAASSHFVASWALSLCPPFSPSRQALICKELPTIPSTCYSLLSSTPCLAVTLAWCKSSWWGGRGWSEPALLLRSEVVAGGRICSGVAHCLRCRWQKESPRVGWGAMIPWHFLYKRPHLCSPLPISFWALCWCCICQLS